MQKKWTKLNGEKSVIFSPSEMNAIARNVHYQVGSWLLFADCFVVFIFSCSRSRSSAKTYEWDVDL